MTAAKKTSASRALPAPAATARLRVLIADDHDIVHHGLQQLLRASFGAGIRFGGARNSAEVLQQCAAQDWEVLLLDITMPGRSGLEILNEINRLRPQLPVLIMSAFPEEEFALRALKSGAAGYLDKRTLAAEIGPALERVLTGERYVSPAFAAKLAAQIGQEQTRPAHDTLSQREFQVLRLIAAGKTLKEIAGELSLSEKTVGTYRARISEKLQIGTNVELTRYALQHRLVE